MVRAIRTIVKLGLLDPPAMVPWSKIESAGEQRGASAQRAEGLRAIHAETKRNEDGAHTVSGRCSGLLECAEAWLGSGTRAGQNPDRQILSRSAARENAGSAVKEPTE